MSESVVSPGDVVAVARSYLGTPFAHAQRTKGVAVDCAGLIICVAKELGLVDESFDFLDYPPVPDGRSLLSVCARLAGRSVTQSDMRAGHILVVRTSLHPQHLGILSDYPLGGLALIHASANLSLQPPRVVESRLLLGSRVQRFAAAFEFPGVVYG